MTAGAGTWISANHIPDSVFQRAVMYPNLQCSDQFTQYHMSIEIERNFHIFLGLAAPELKRG